jgi:hypothetical protein
MSVEVMEAVEPNPQKPKPKSDEGKENTVVEEQSGNKRRRG